MVLDWVDPQADRLLSLQRAQVDNAKIIATFSSGVAATIVSTALQLKVPASEGIRALWALGLSVVLVLFVILADRLRAADHDDLLKLAQLNSWSYSKYLWELRSSTLIAVHENNVFVLLVKILAVLQVLTASASGVLAANAILG